MIGILLGLGTVAWVIDTLTSDSNKQTAQPQPYNVSSNYGKGA